MFKERKTAQMAAYLLRARGGWMSHLKLMKLLYLADREAMRRYGMPMSGDRFVSMPHGPVLSLTLSLMDGNIPSSPGGWEDWISDKENHELSLRHSVSDAELDELSQADREILEHIWGAFGRMSRWDLRDYTHQHCPEWKDPNGSSVPIGYDEVFHALGWDQKNAAAQAGDIEAERAVDRLFSRL